MKYKQLYIQDELFPVYYTHYLHSVPIRVNRINESKLLSALGKLDIFFFFTFANFYMYT